MSSRSLIARMGGRSQEENDLDADQMFRCLDDCGPYEATYRLDKGSRLYYPFWVAVNAVIDDYSPVNPIPDVDIYCQVWYQYPESKLSSLEKFFKQHNSVLSKQALKLSGVPPKISFFFPLNENVLFEHAEGKAQYLETSVVYNQDTGFLHVQLHVLIRLPLQQQSLIRNFPLDRAYLPFELMTKRGDKLDGRVITWKAFELWGSWPRNAVPGMEDSDRFLEIETLRSKNETNYQLAKDAIAEHLLGQKIYGLDLKAFSLRKEQNIYLNFYEVMSPRWYEKGISRRPVFVVRLQNRGWHFVYNYQVPVFLLVSFVLLTAWYETRQSVNNVGLIQVSFFCVSGIIAVRFVMASTLPHIAGFTVGDAYITLSFFFPVLALAMGLAEELTAPSTNYGGLEIYVYVLAIVWILINMAFLAMIFLRTAGSLCSGPSILAPLSTFDEIYSFAFGERQPLTYEGPKRFMKKEMAKAVKKPNKNNSARTRETAAEKGAKVTDAKD